MPKTKKAPPRKPERGITKGVREKRAKAKAKALEKVKEKEAPPPRTEIPLTEACLIKTKTMDKSNDWCNLDIRIKRSHVQCYAKRLRTDDPKMTFGRSMRKAWDYYRKKCKGD